MTDKVERRGPSGELLGRVWWMPGDGIAYLRGWHASYPGDFGEPSVFDTRDEAIAFMDKQISEADR